MARNTPFPQQLEKATTAQLSSMKGVVGELIYDTDKKTVVPMDGSTDGGHPVALAERKIISATPELQVNNGTEATLASDITLKLAGVVGDQTWGKVVIGAVPTEQAEVDAIAASSPHGAFVYFSESGLYQLLKPEGENASLLRVDSCCDGTSVVLDQANEALELARQYAAGQFVVVADPDFMLPAEVAASSTLNITMSSQAYLDNQSLAKFIITCPELSLSTEVAASGNTAVYALDVPADTTHNTVLHVSVKAVDTAGNESRSIERTTTVKSLQVATPSIVSPVNGSTVKGLDKVTLIGSAFAMASGTGSQSGADWKLTSNAAGNTIVAEANNSSDLTQHEFTGLSLTAGSTYYAFVRYRISTGEMSAWSAASSFVAEAAGVEIVSGVTIERHPTEPGSVLSWYDIGTSSNVNLLVFDAVKRRADLAWNPSTTYTDSPLPNLQSPNANGTWYIDGSSTPVTQATAALMTMEQFNVIWPKNVLDPNTAKYNCDQWALLGISNYPCLQYVRSILTTDGKQANVPNIQQLMRIFSCAEALDARDTSLSSYPSFALTGWFNNSWAWASSEYNNGYERYVSYNGYCYRYTKTSKGVAVPVLEI